MTELWRARRTQLGTVVRLELRKTLLGRRALWVYLLAFAPVLILGADALQMVMRHKSAPVDQGTEELARIFQLYYLRLGLFFGCLGIFTRLFRGDMMERTIHFYLLAPVRRELVACGKFAAGVVAVLAIFGLSVTASFAFMYLFRGPAGVQFVLAGAGLAHLGAYLTVTALAAVGYGALFMLLGLLLRNPIVPAVLLLVWESINPILPGSLKILSVIFYLEPLLPVEVPAQGLAALFAIPSDPIAPYLAIPGLLLVSAAILTVVCLRVRQTEIDYSAD